jgi:hypothetical protein
MMCVCISTSTLKPIPCQSSAIDRCFKNNRVHGSTIGLPGISFGENEIQSGVQVIEIKLFAQVLKVSLGSRMEHDPPDSFGAIIKFDFHDQQVFGSSILISGFSCSFVLV